MTKRTLAIALLLDSIARVSHAIAAGPVVEPGVAFVAGDAVDHNGPIPVAYAAATCGSNTASYLAELLDVFPTNAKVTKHWPDIVPDKVFVLSGTVEQSSLGTGDLPFDHPFGSDLNFDVLSDP